MKILLVRFIVLALKKPWQPPGECPVATLLYYTICILPLLEYKLLEDMKVFSSS